MQQVGRILHRSEAVPGRSRGDASKAIVGEGQRGPRQNGLINTDEEQNRELRYQFAPGGILSSRLRILGLGRSQFWDEVLIIRLFKKKSATQ